MGADGRFSLELTAPGIFTVRALADGWAPHYRAEVIIGGVADTEIVLPLTQGYAVVGYALDATNRPVGDTAIALYQMNRRAFSFSKSLTRTDGGGRFEFRVEPSAQEYTVSALFKDGLNIAKRFRVPLTEDLVLRTPGQGALLGRVVDARTGQGVPGASVLIVLSSGGRRRVWGFPEQGKALKTDDYGAFRLEGIGAGSIQSLSIRAVGHPDLQLGGWVSNDPELWARIESIELTGAGETELPTIQLEAGRPLRGVITDRSDDKPIDGARVEIWDFMMGSRETFSDAEGRYAFDAVGERVSMVVEKEGYAPFRESPFPGHQLGGGESAALRDFQLEAGGRVEGQVKTAAGEPVARALVRLRPADAGWRSMGLAASLRRAWTHTDEEGNYVLSSVPAAKLYAEVEAPGYDIGRSEQKQIEAGQLLKRLDIRMQEAARLEGRVLSRDSTPVPGVRITVARDPGPDADLRAQWMALREGIYAFGDDQGRFSVLNVPVGDVIIRLEADGYATTT
ncbi:MAG: collagen binding domain-containing protein, partial [Planctomycetota bacterium]